MILFVHPLTPTVRVLAYLDVLPGNKLMSFRSAHSKLAKDCNGARSKDIKYYIDLKNWLRLVKTHLSKMEC